MTTRGSYVHNSMVTFSGESRKFKFNAIFSKYWWFQTKWFTRLLELIQFYKQNPLEIFFLHYLPKLYIGFNNGEGRIWTKTCVFLFASNFHCCHERSIILTVCITKKLPIWIIKIYRILGLTYPSSASSSGTNLSCTAPTPRWQAWGEGMMAATPLTPYSPKFEILNVPPCKGEKK